MTTDCGPDPAFAASPSSQSTLSRPSGLQSGVEVLDDNAGAFGAVIASLHFATARDARFLRAILVSALNAGAINRERINQWVAEIDSALHRAACDRWLGWESVHSLDSLALAAGTQRAETSETSARAEGCQSGAAKTAQRPTPPIVR